MHKIKNLLSVQYELKEKSVHQIKIQSLHDLKFNLVIQKHETLGDNDEFVNVLYEMYDMICKMHE